MAADAFAAKMRQAELMLDAAEAVASGDPPPPPPPPPGEDTASFAGDGRPLGLGLRQRPEAGSRDWQPAYRSELGRFNGPAGEVLAAGGCGRVGDLIAAVGEVDTAGQPHDAVIRLIKARARCAAAVATSASPLVTGRAAVFAPRRTGPFTIRFLHRPPITAAPAATPPPKPPKPAGAAPAAQTPQLKPAPLLPLPATPQKPEHPPAAPPPATPAATPLVITLPPAPSLAPLTPAVAAATAGAVPPATKSPVGAAVATPQRRSLFGGGRRRGTPVSAKRASQNATPADAEAPGEAEAPDEAEAGLVQTLDRPSKPARPPPPVTLKPSQAAAGTPRRRPSLEQLEELQRKLAGMSATLESIGVRQEPLPVAEAETEVEVEADADAEPDLPSVAAGAHEVGGVTDSQGAWLVSAPCSAELDVDAQAVAEAEAIAAAVFVEQEVEQETTRVAAEDMDRERASTESKTAAATVEAEAKMAAIESAAAAAVSAKAAAAVVEAAVAEAAAAEPELTGQSTFHPSSQQLAIGLRVHARLEKRVALVVAGGVPAGWEVGELGGGRRYWFRCDQSWSATAILVKDPYSNWELS